MTSSLQVIEHLKAQFDASEMADSVLTMIVEMAEGRNQFVFAAVIENVLVLKSPVAPFEGVKASRLLELEDGAFFGIQRFAEQYVLANSMPIENLTSKAIDQMVTLLAHQADSLQAQITAGDPY